MKHETVYILDFGAQYAQLIARRVREHHCYCEIVPFSVDIAQLRGAKGLILTGGPASVYADGAPHCDPQVFDLGVPVLGICYGPSVRGVARLASCCTGSRGRRPCG